MTAFLGTIGFGLMATTGITLLLLGTPAKRTAALANESSMPLPSRTGIVPTPVANPSSVSVGGLTLISQSVELPTSDRMFEGAGADAINNNCLACHSSGMVRNQPAMSRAEWQREVNKMRNVFKAPVNDDDVVNIVDYLVRTDGHG